MVSTARSRVREPAGNLPADVTSFVGRRHEITLTKRLLAESRVVTLTGPGGVGKTRLALRVASGMRRSFRDKAWCVGLEELRDGSLLPEAVIEQLNLGGPAGGSDVDTVVEHLKHREMLLVLDNCEHVIEDAALFADAVIRWCPGVRVLATSRQSLGVAGEATLVVPPLQVPDPADPPPPESHEQFSSVRLFLDRARATVPDFEVGEDGAVLMRLCAELDGNPLAIELAAVRLRSLSLHQLEERLVERYQLLSEGRRGAPERQQSLRALIDWSWELCSEQDRTAWARVSVFAGSFGLAAAEHVASDGLSPVNVLGAMHSLVDQSILTREEEAGEVRFRLPRTLRDYGAEHLDEAEWNRVLRRHQEWYAQLAERFAADWLGSDQVAWVRELRLDLDNLRLALDTAVHHPETAPAALRTASWLAPFWGIRGLNGEARHWLTSALAQVPADSPERAAGLRANAWFALMQGDTAAADPLLDEAAALAERYSDEEEQALIVQMRGMATFFRGDMPEALELLGDALDRFRALEGTAYGELFGLFGLGLAKGLSGDHEGGLVLLRECIELTTARGELFWRSYALWATAYIEVLRGISARAETAAKEALRFQRRLDNRLAGAFAIDILAWIAHRLGRNERAARLFGAAAAVWDAVRSAPSFYSNFQAQHAEHERGVREALGERTFVDAFERGYRMAPGAAIDYALELKRSERAAAAPEQPEPTALTRREREIAELVAQGRTNKEIAESLVIAQRTVEGHVQHILTKLDFSSRAQIAGWLAGRRPE